MIAQTILIITNKRIKELTEEVNKYQNAKDFDERMYLHFITSTLQLNKEINLRIRKFLPTLED